MSLYYTYFFIGGAASYYAAEARELNKQIRSKQHNMQMELFLQANKVGVPYIFVLLRRFCNQNFRYKKGMLQFFV
jgi:hypothetical protein